MKWEGKNINDLDDDHLKSAYIALAEMDNARENSIRNPKREFKSNPNLSINTIFLELQKEIEEELKKRELFNDL
jgi:hypothetical protein